jgi:hypothetical protein
MAGCLADTQLAFIGRVVRGPWGPSKRLRTDRQIRVERAQPPEGAFRELEVSRKAAERQAVPGLVLAYTSNAA